MSKSTARPDDVIVVGNSSDDPFAIDVAFAVGQTEDINGEKTNEEYPAEFM